MAQKGSRRRNTHHGLANKGENGQESNGFGTQVHHVDLIMGEYNIEEIRKGGTRPTHRASARYGTSLAVLSMDKWDAGHAIILPNSLKMVARAKLTLPKPSAGVADGGGQGGDTGFFPLPFFVGAMAMGRGEARD